MPRFHAIVGDVPAERVLELLIPGPDEKVPFRFIPSHHCVVTNYPGSENFYPHHAKVATWRELPDCRVATLPENIVG
jgi:hypothetical protein